MGEIFSMNAIFFADAADAAAAAVPAGNWLMLIIPAVVPVVIAVIKFFIPKLPSVWLPILAPILGAVAELLLSGNFGVWGAVAGAAGVGLREIVDQLKKLQGAEE